MAKEFFHRSLLSLLDGFIQSRLQSSPFSRPWYAESYDEGIAFKQPASFSGRQIRLKATSDHSTKLTKTVCSLDSEPENKSWPIPQDWILKPVYFHKNQGASCQVCLWSILLLHPFPQFKWQHSRLSSWESRIPQLYVGFQISCPQPFTPCSHLTQ